MKPWNILEKEDPEVYGLIEQELQRQNDGIELIASENFASPAVITAMSNVMTNKYAEGLPKKRYYGGCEFVDTVEELAIERVCRLFGCKYANVQPHSGAQANAAVLMALAQPQSRILGLDLSSGGHLTHGSKVNFSGTYFESFFYGLDADSERLDYDKILKLAQEIKPQIIIAGASAYPREIDFAFFRKIADQVGAYLLVDMAHIAGLVAAKLHNSPFPHAHVVTSTTHKTLRGPRGGIILWNEEELSKIINKSVFPGTQGGPLEHIIAAKAVSFKEASTPAFVEYQKRTINNARALAQRLSEKDFKIVSNGTDNHLVLLDLSSSEVSGKQFEEALGCADITVNKNTVPKETRSPFVTSGIRIGTPAVTTRGMNENEMILIADFIKECFDSIGSQSELEKIKLKVKHLTKEFPLYSEWR